MSFKEITITTVEGNTLTLAAVRKIECRSERRGFLTIGQKFTKKVQVQYGIGIAGKGENLKDAVADFRKNWTEFCAQRA